MFTGIIEHIGLIIAISGPEITIGDAAPVLGDAKVGDQMGVNGVSLTVQWIDEGRTQFKVHVTPETARRSNLGSLAVITKDAGTHRTPLHLVNLERPLHKDSRFGGHFVQGHIDTTASLLSITPDPPGASKIYTFEVAEDQLPYIVAKGNITLDGASLTIVSVDSPKKTFSILLTPYTATHVTLGQKQVGSKVNVEVDVVGKYVEKVVSKLRDSAGEEASSSKGAVVNAKGTVTADKVSEKVHEVISAFASAEAAAPGSDAAVRRVLENVVEGTVRNVLGAKVVDAKPRFTGKEAEKSYEESLGGEEKFEFDDMEEALAEFAKGNFLVVVDSIDRENEGDLIASAQHMTPQKMAFMVRHTSGIICVPLQADRCAQLGLPLMVPPAGNQEYMGTAFTVTVDLRAGTTTGVSANDRTLTVRALADEGVKGEEFVQPGHIFPLMYRKGGVLKRTGHTEAGVDLCKLTGLYPAAALSEIVLDNGEMARRDDLKKLAKEWGLKMISIEDMALYRRMKGFTGEDW